MKCPACNAIIPDDTDICPACFSQIQTVQEPLAPPPPAATRANPREVEIQSETSLRSREGHSSTPPSETRVRGNVEGRFSGRVPRKGLFLVAGIIAVIILAAVGYITLANRQAAVPSPPVTQEHPAPEKPAEQTQAPAKEEPAEGKPAEVKQAPAPVQKKTVKKVPKVQAPAPAPAPSSKWTYRPDPQPKPAPKPQAPKAGIAGWLDKALGPEKPVTQPSNDPRYTGQ